MVNNTLTFYYIKETFVLVGLCEGRVTACLDVMRNKSANAKVKLVEMFTIESQNVH